MSQSQLVALAKVTRKLMPGGTGRNLGKNDEVAGAGVGRKYEPAFSRGAVWLT